MRTFTCLAALTLVFFAGQWHGGGNTGTLWAAFVATFLAVVLVLLRVLNAAKEQDEREERYRDEIDRLSTENNKLKKQKYGIRSL